MQPPPSPENDLKQSVVTLKDSTVAFLKTKAELAAIESREAADYAKQKGKLVAIVATVGAVSYALFLVFLHSIIQHFGGGLISAIQGVLPLSASEVSLLVLLIPHLIVFLIFLLKLKKFPKTELFPLTKSEFKKDQEWLKEMNNNAR